MRRGIVLIGALGLAACAKPAPEGGDSQAVASSAAQAAAAASTEVPDEAGAAASAAPASAKTATPAPAPEAPSASRDPGEVVLAWAKAMSLKQWGLAYRYWGDDGARSGLSLFQFSEKWGRLRNPEFELHKGTTEGAAGSSYYTAPIVLIDGKRHTRGQIVLRRVNDVPGASAEQLRWHIESLSIQP